MCRPGWGSARAEARRLEGLARLRRVRDRIDRDYARPLNVPALAREAGLPVGVLVLSFGEAYGRTPHAYLTARRAERAAYAEHTGQPVHTGQLGRAGRAGTTVRNREAAGAGPVLR
ncbi:AraC family transcriptional regulator [Streptomyces sp. NPDC097619]|uniref:AraC family transcriptional regulator n=1 Tax=Streptomyces sp. NPDC097619 TaxID=3157228 RepID=UPI003317076C